MDFIIALSKSLFNVFIWIFLILFESSSHCDVNMKDAEYFVKNISLVRPTVKLADWINS